MQIKRCLGMQALWSQLITSIHLLLISTVPAFFYPHQNSSIKLRMMDQEGISLVSIPTLWLGQESSHHPRQGTVQSCLKISSDGSLVMQVLLLLNSSHGQEIPPFFKFGSFSVSFWPLVLSYLQALQGRRYGFNLHDSHSSSRRMLLFLLLTFFFGLNLPCFNRFSQNCLPPNKTQYYMCGLTSTLVYSSVSQSQQL